MEDVAAGHGQATPRRPAARPPAGTAGRRRRRARQSSQRLRQVRVELGHHPAHRLLAACRPGRRGRARPGCAVRTASGCAARWPARPDRGSRVGQRVAVHLERDDVGQPPGGGLRVRGVELGRRLVHVERCRRTPSPGPRPTAAAGSRREHHVHLQLRARRAGRPASAPVSSASTAGAAPHTTWPAVDGLRPRRRRRSSAPSTPSGAGLQRGDRGPGDQLRAAGPRPRRPARR